MENNTYQPTTLERLGITKRTWFSVGGILAFALFSILLAWVNADFSIETMKTASYWVDVATKAFYTMYGMLSGQQIGEDIYKNGLQCAYRVALKKCNETINTIRSKGLFVYFDDWLHTYKEKKLYNKKKTFLENYDVRQYEVLDLDATDIKYLNNAYCKDWNNTPHKGKYKDDKTYFMAYDEQQIKAISKCIKGGVKLAPLPSTFFRHATNDNNTDMWEDVAKKNARVWYYKIGRMAKKIISIVVLSAILQGFTSSTDGNISEIMLNVGTNLIAILGSVFYGVMTIGKTSKEETNVILYKESVLNEFLTESSNGMYKLQNLEDMAREEYEKNNPKKEDNSYTITQKDLEMYDIMGNPITLPLKPKEVIPNGSE